MNIALLMASWIELAPGTATTDSLFSMCLILAIVAGSVGAGWGIANEKKWGYYLGVGMALFPSPGGCITAVASSAATSSTSCSKSRWSSCSSTRTAATPKGSGSS